MVWAEIISLRKGRDGGLLRTRAMNIYLYYIKAGEYLDQVKR
jgi:hypothetical protein